MDKCREVNNRLHGIYNQQDKTAWHNNLYFNAFLAMKGWVLGYLENMVSPNHHSVVLEKNTEGFLNTLLKVPFSTFMHHIRGDQGMNITNMLITMVAPWSKRSKNAMKAAGFSDAQNFNARRMVASELLMLFLYLLHAITAPPEDDEKDDEELGIAQGLIYYMAYRTLLEQRVFLEPSETYIQSGSIMDLVPVGVAALFDLGKLIYEGAGSLVADEDNKDFYYQSDSGDDRYEKGDLKFETHLERLIPYWKSWWALQHPYEAKDNYEFGRKMRTR